MCGGVGASLLNPSPQVAQCSLDFACNIHMEEHTNSRVCFLHIAHAPRTRGFFTRGSLTFSTQGSVALDRKK